ncbi:MAG: hypothetical protein AAF740_10845 [Bacteroidota bacterium]
MEHSSLPSNPKSEIERELCRKVRKEITLNGVHDDPNKSDDNDMITKENILWGIGGGLLAAVAAAFVWAEATIILEKDWAYDPQFAYMAVLVGLAVGLAVRYLGKGRRKRFGLIAIGLAILGCVLGNVFSSVAYVVATLELSYFTVIKIFDASQLWGLIKDRFASWDILFYSLSIIFAYFFSVRGSVKRLAHNIELAFLKLKV